MTPVAKNLTPRYTFGITRIFVVQLILSEDGFKINLDTDMFIYLLRTKPHYN